MCMVFVIILVRTNVNTLIDMISPHRTTKILGLIQSIFYHLADMCQVHTVLHDDDRNIHRQISQNGQCDSNLKTGWYRFLNISGVKMPTNCLDPDTCDAQFPGWLKSSHPTVEEGEVAGKVCFSRSSAQCCYRSKDIRVKNCSSFYVYRLVPTNCPNRYCFINN